MLFHFFHDSLTPPLCELILRWIISVAAVRVKVPVARACAEKADAAIRLLEQESAKPGFDINCIYPALRMTLLHIASSNNNLPVVEWLIARGAIIDLEDEVLCFSANAVAKPL